MQGLRTYCISRTHKKWE